MNSTVLTAASRQWASRPADERYLSLDEMLADQARRRQRSISRVTSNRAVALQAPDRSSLQLVSNNDAVEPTNWAFGQLSQLAGAPAGYLRTLPAPMAADCINYGLRFRREVQDVGLLIDQEGNELRAATGPAYGRIWNEDVVQLLRSRFGDGVSGDWRVPGEFGREIVVNRRNTTLYAGDRDMFVFLADERNRIDVPNRRDGLSGSVARGFFVWNSEVGSATCGAAFFLFDYACQNRCVWGAQDLTEVRIRHSSGAPLRWLEEVTPVLMSISEASAKPITEAIKAAQEQRFSDDLDAFLAKRQFSRSEIERAKLAHVAEEGRPIETVFDAVVGITAAAKSITWQNERVDLERRAGKLLKAAA